MENETNTPGDVHANQLGYIELQLQANTEPLAPKFDNEDIPLVSTMKIEKPKVKKEEIAPGHGMII